jgi:hypothetical protein
MSLRSNTKLGLLIMILFSIFSVHLCNAQHKLIRTLHQQTKIIKSEQNDFDDHFGKWKTKLKRLKNPLSSSTIWLDYEGTTFVKSLWNGRANIVELDVKGESGHIEGVSLRLYNPQTKQWSLNFASLRDGIMTIPTIGGFKNGVGEFFNEDTFNGKKILVRFIITKTSTNSFHFEQAFSEDSGKTWEVNWIADDTRIKK